MKPIALDTARISDYLAHHTSNLRSAQFPLDVINTRKIEGLQNDIDLFQNVSMDEIKFLSRNFSVVNLQRGCYQGCKFCLRNALKPLTETASQISSVLWDDLTRFALGFGKLNERIGVNVLGRNSYLAVFEDSNLPELILKDKLGRKYDVADAVKLLYENLRIPVTFVTAGWNPKNLEHQKSAEKLLQYVLNNPESSTEFAVSINPFFSGTKKAYIEKVSNTLKTFLPLFSNDRRIGSVLIKYNYPSGVGADINGFKPASKLYKEIFAELEKLTGNDLCNYEILNPKNINVIKSSNFIENKGRGMQYFQPAETEKKLRELNIKSFNWLTMTPKQKADFAYNCTTKNVDINGNIYLITPDEQIIKTDLNLNYINSKKNTAKVHSDVEYYPFKKEFLTA